MKRRGSGAVSAGAPGRRRRSQGRRAAPRPGGQAGARRGGVGRATDAEPPRGEVGDHGRLVGGVVHASPGSSSVS